MSEELIYLFEIKIDDEWVNPISGCKFPTIRDCWKFGCRNRNKFNNYKQRIVGVNLENDIKFAVSLTISRLDFYEDYYKNLENLS